MKKFFSFYLIVIAFGFLPAFSLSAASTPAATEYTLLAPLPYVATETGGKVATPKSYIEGAVKLAVAVSGVLAVLMLIAAGIEYMSTEAITGKSQAKEKIQNALTGLFLVLASYLILNTVNPQLLNLNLSIENLPVGAGFDTGVVPTTTEGGALPSRPDGTRDYSTPAENGGYGSCKAVGCVPLRYPDLKTPNCGSPNGCEINQQLGVKLIQIDQLQGKGNWIITEAWPPTTNHISSCHQPGARAGMCVDAAIRNSKEIPPSVEEVRTFLKNIRTGLGGKTFQYEVAGAARVKLLKEKLGNEFSIVDLGALGTGEHAHINLP